MTLEDQLAEAQAIAVEQQRQYNRDVARVSREILTLRAERDALLIDRRATEVWLGALRNAQEEWPVIQRNLDAILAALAEPVRVT